MTEACADRIDDIVDALTGNLSDERKAEFDAHTQSCVGCAAELGELSSSASLLRGADIDLDAVMQLDTPPAGLRARVTQTIDQARTEQTTIRQLRTGRPRARRVSLALLAAAVVIALVATVGLRQSSPGTRQEQVALTAKYTAPGASATAALRPQGHGTAIHLDVAGLDEGAVYALWLADASGARSPAGTFVPGDDGTATVDTNAALPRDQAVKIWITDPDNTTVLAAPLS